MATHNDQNQEVQVGHVVSIKFLTAICCILLFLTGVTVWVSRYDFTEINIAEMGIITALLVATVKATFVGLYFMHLRWDRPFIGFVFVGSILFVVLFIAIALTDTMEYQPQIIKGDTPEVVEAMNKIKEGH
ncbi:MAG TPA: cytochrome C oxidase subunit IV family protein [Phycisphaerales bacterium]|jgi:cytochrome c oxidase subunit 4|nr:cytochrome C oxidase subunit IV family protein [Phycisphaerales bacterium]|tara:strand:+ start:67 stop:459 length:393 start_codon:yes stop_codon:yes gene_type:complete